MTSSKLRADSKRDATDSIRGYVYQAYQSVLAWTNLNQDETLVLEGAEDFDIYEQQQATVTQVKDLSGNITLRSRSVIDAINNFWSHSQNNPNNQVKFRFLSTTHPGCEKGSPFGTNINGLDYWQGAANSKVDIQPLRSFLLNLDLSRSLKEFLKDSNDKIVKEKLLIPIKWDLGSKPIVPLQDAIHDNLILHGHQLGINSYHSSNSLDHLLRKIVDLLTKEGPKALTRVDFLRSFDDATTEAVPRGELEALRHSSRLYKLAGTADAFRLDQLVSSPPSITSAPPAVNGQISRSSLTQSLAETAKRQSILFLHGSSGLGKTNLALLIAQKITQNWGWCGFRGLSGEQIQNTLRHASFELNTSNITPYLVLDDLDLRSASQYERELITLFFRAKDAGGVILITSPFAPSLQLLPKLWANEESQTQVPPFQERDISEMLEKHGLKDAHALNSWSKLIFLTTGGHPQLVHARVRSLVAQGWPKPKKDDLAKPEAVEKVRSEARQRLMQEIPSENVRVLAYRLSLISGSFSREMATSLAAAPPPLRLAGEAFDTLVGPWVENEGDNRYRTSPLLIGAAESNLSANEIRTVHETIAIDAMNRETTNKAEIGTALLHAILAKSTLPILYFSQIIIRENQSKLNELSGKLEWLPILTLDSDRFILPSDPSIEVILRLAQYRISVASGNSNRSLNIIDHIQSCINRLEEPNSRQYSEALAYGIILNTLEIHIPAGVVVSMLSKLIEHADTIDEISEIHRTFAESSQDLPKFGDNLPAQVLFSYQAVRTAGLDDLVDLLDALNALTEEKRNHLLATCKSDSDFAGMLISRAWWKEVKNGSLDIEKTTVALNKAIDCATAWQCSEIIIAASVALSVIADEYEKVPAKALDLVRNALSNFPNALPLLNQKAKVLFHSGNYKEVLELASTIGGSKELSSVELTFTLRMAGISAAKLDNWNRAEDYFLEGAKLSHDTEFLKTTAIGLMADAAFARWMSKNYSGSLELFCDTLTELEEIPLSQELNVRHLHATVGHTVAWIYFETRHEASDELMRPLPGMCSKPDPHEGMKDLEIKELSTVWQLLANAEKLLKLDVGIQNKSQHFTGGKRTLVIETSQRFAELNAVYINGDFEHLIPAYVRAMEALETSKKLNEEGLDASWSSTYIPKLPTIFWSDPAQQERVQNFMLEATVILLSKSPKIEFPIASWRASLLELAGTTEATERFLHILEGGLPPNMVLQEQVAFALISLQQGPLPPDELWTSLFRVLNLFLYGSKYCAKHLETLSNEKWLYALEHQRFAFLSPQLYCPSIEAACRNSALSGLPKVAHVLLTSAQALKINMSPESLSMLKEIERTVTQ
ncbi:hypothetical protein [Thalassospira sp. UBA1131]|uniref:hypothetical protein n=1 Tax=Thalassospira sp. UBA1131 TaxID=1947672 RepID=UPI0025CBEABB|nr:hypothetical protein [Thalassospira sp. UBA1131]